MIDALSIDSGEMEAEGKYAQHGREEVEVELG